MKARISYLTGPRAGQSLVLDKPYVTIGRHPLSDVRFSPDEDLTVSGRHAALVLRDGVYLLRDLGSTNGTMVNGVRLFGEHVLADRDVIQLGANGPSLRFGIIWQDRQSLDQTPTVSMQAPSPTTAATRLRPTPYGDGGVPQTPTVVRRAVQKHTHRLRTMVVALTAVFGLLIIGGVWQVQRSDRQLHAERERLLRQADSLILALSAVGDTGNAIRTALAEAQAETGRLRGAIESAGSNRGELDDLRQRMKIHAAEQSRLASIASLDATTISRENSDAVAIVLVEYPDGRRFTGTAFAVRSDADGGWLVTSKHVVQDSSGTRPSRLGVVFNGSNQNFRTTVESVHPTADVALLRVAVARGVPVVKGLAEPSALPSPGDPVVLVGFPLGLELPMGGDWRKLGVSTSTTLAAVSKSLPNLLQLDGFGAEGASGSPVFDRSGRVVGVLYGGERGTDGRVIFAVPAGAVRELLATAGTGHGR